MLKNHLVIAWRNLLKNKLYSLINIAGLATGMACCILVALFVYDEWSYDRFHENAGRIYRVLREVKKEDGSVIFHPQTAGVLATQLEEMPEVERALRVWNRSAWSGISVSYGDKRFGQGFCAAEAELLDAFDFPLLKGDAQTALRAPASVVLTQQMAQKLFGDEDPLGKVLQVEDKAFAFDGQYTITGVLRDMPKNATLRFPFLTALPLGRHGLSRWREGRPGAGGPNETYVLARAGHDRRALERRLRELGAKFSDDPETGFVAYHLQPLTEIYLYSGRDYGIDKSGDPRGYGHITHVYQIAVVALAVLLIAGINFANLSTAQAAGRAREVGVRKAMGARRRQLVGQFVGESTLMTLAALGVASVLCALFLPTFNELMGKELGLFSSGKGWILGLLLTFAGLVGILASLYPAFILSAFEPVGALRGGLRADRKGIGIRKGLVAFQFAAAVFFVVCTVCVHAQLEYIDNKDLGFARSQVIHMQILNTVESQLVNPSVPLASRYNEVKEAFLAHSNIIAASATISTPPWWAGHKLTVRPEGLAERQMDYAWVDEDFLETFEVELLAGRNFSATIASDKTEAFLLNETAVAHLGWGEPLGKRLSFDDREGVVIGVVEDFHAGSLRYKISPMLLGMHPKFTTVTLRLGSGDFASTESFVEQTAGRFMTGFGGAWDSMWSHHHLYRNEQRFGRVFRLVSYLSIFVAGLGLFGLASFAARKRTNEIAIRKVLGASASHIGMLFIAQFAGLVLLGNALAWPLAYYVMGQWLSDFAYRVDLGLPIFLLGSGIALGVAALSMSIQVLRSTRLKPVEALKSE
ncbi:MAG: FtsX-like permease family protein [Candidatus Latescibacteria bacterium]|nr:FtsX-like permease family protein [Candidatus Latescibacterota bacterium]